MRTFEGVRIVPPYAVQHSVPDEMGVCRFGIIESIVAIATAVSAAASSAAAWVGGGITDALVSAGVGADTAGLIGSALGDASVGSLTGGALGTAEAAATGQPLLKGLESGAITGGVLAGGGPLLNAAFPALGTTASDVIAGAAGGTLGSGATGGNLATGALGGAVSGGLASALAPSATTPTQGTPTAGAAGSAVAQAPPASVAAAPGATGGDVTLSTPPTETSGGISAALPSGSTGGANIPGWTTPAAAPAPSSSGGLLSQAGDWVSNQLGFGSSTPATTAGTAPTAPTTTAPSATAPTSSSWLGRNASWLVPGAGLVYEAVKGNQPLPDQAALESAAASAANQARSLESYYQNGTLPQGLQAGIDQASEAAKASIKSMYAARGMSGSSAEAQDISNVDVTAKVQGAQIAIQLLQQGISEQGLANSLYEELLNVSLQQDQNLSNAFAQFATGLAGTALKAA